MTGRSTGVTKQRQRGLINIHELSPSRQWRCWFSGSLAVWKERHAGRKCAQSGLRFRPAPRFPSANHRSHESRFCVICDGNLSQKAEMKTQPCSEKNSASKAAHISRDITFLSQRLETSHWAYRLTQWKISNPIQWINTGCIFMRNLIDSE